ncbi:MAG: Holliday junction branch migration protein RuvA [Chitinophagales bacterium]|nr:Holliday junction branch migration protein RuvA [Chitinophagales bacterium]
MIAYLKGKLAHKTPTFVFVEVQGVGYQVFVSLQTYEKIKDAKECVLFTHMVVKNENQSVSAFLLYGFYEEKERDLFEKLLSVSGVGSSTAIMMLSTYKTAEISSAITSGDVGLLKSIKGIGPKSAQRIILELKDKLDKMPQFEQEKGVISNTVKEEALTALVSLGFNKATCVKTINQVQRDYPEADTVEQIIKLSLKLL